MEKKTNHGHILNRHWRWLAFQMLIKYIYFIIMQFLPHILKNSSTCTFNCKMPVVSNACLTCTHYIIISLQMLFEGTLRQKTISQHLLIIWASPLALIWWIKFLTTWYYHFLPWMYGFDDIVNFMAGCNFCDTPCISCCLGINYVCLFILHV